MRIPTIRMIVLLLVACGGVNETAKEPARTGHGA